METLTRNIPSPLLTEKEAACYLSRSCSSLRRDRRNGHANVFGPKGLFYLLPASLRQKK